MIAIQIIDKNNNIPKQSIQEVEVLTALMPNLLDKSENKVDSLNNKSLNYKKAISNGDVIDIFSEEISAKTHNST